VSDKLSPLERDVLELLLAPDHPVMHALRRQLVRCRVASREITGVGFFTTLEVDKDVEAAPVTSARRLILDDVKASVEGLEHGAGFALFIENGVLDTLEGFSYVGLWTDMNARYELTSEGVRHSGGSLTDMEQVHDLWDRSGDSAGLSDGGRS
jgi:hypothetical protein